MSQTLTGTNSTDPTLTPQATVPVDGDPANATSVNGAFQSILNALGWLRKNAVFGVPSKTTVSQNDTTFFNQVAGPGGWQGSLSRPVSYWNDRGQVRVRGTATNINNNGTAQVLTFPAGYRPPATVPVLVRLVGYTTLYTGTVSSAGVLTLDAGAQASGATSYDLDLVTFPTF